MEDTDSLTFNPLQDNEDDLGSLEDTDVCVTCSKALENSLLLVCLHSICRNCVSSQTTEHIKCPRCRSTSACRSLRKDYLHCSEPPGPKVLEDSQLVVEISNIISKGQGRIKSCNENVNKLTNNLGEIHEERENLKKQIEATYNMFKSILEECKNDSLLQLENAHNDKELTVMDLLQDLNISQNNLDHTISYVNRILKEFPNTEALSILPMAKIQLESNLRHLESLAEKDEPPSLVWKTNPKEFRKISRDCFGSLVENNSAAGENLVIPDIAQQDVITLKEPFTKAIREVDQKPRQQRTMDLLSPIGADQGFVSPGDQINLLSPIEGQDLLTVRTPTTLQVPTFPGHQDSLSIPCGSPRNPTPHPYGPIGSSLSSPAHKVYSSGRVGNSHPDLYRGHTPPPYGRGHTPPLLGRGHTPPLVGRGITPPLHGQDMIAPPARNGYSFVQLADKIQRSNSGPVNPNFTLADLISNVSEAQSKEWEDPSQAYSNLTALAKLDELQEKNTPWPVDPNLLNPDMDRTTLSRSLSALTSGQLSPVPPPVSPLCGLGVPGMDPRGTSPISPIDSLMPSMGGLSVSPVPPARGNRTINVMHVRSKFGTLGPGKGQFNSPHGFCLGLEEEIIVADTNNHRIQIFEKNGTYRNQFGVPGKEEGQLWYPRKVAVMKTSGNFVICDRGNERSRMQIFNRHGNFIRKIAIRYIDIVAGLAITNEGHIVAVDSVTPTVFVIAEDGDLVRWFDCADFMREPSDIAVSGTEFFVCDFKGHTVVVFSETGTFQRRIGYENITNFPNGIDVSDYGDVLIGDSHGNRFHVAVLSSDGNLLGEFECPHVKVSRCCGLKITREGYVVTLAKNNHHVLVLNTLYIT